MSGLENSYVKVCYEDGDKVRVLRGRLVSENDNGYLILQRLEGPHRIRVDLVQHVSPAANGGGLE